MNTYITAEKLAYIVVGDKVRSMIKHHDLSQRSGGATLNSEDQVLIKKLVESAALGVFEYESFFKALLDIEQLKKRGAEQFTLSTVNHIFVLSVALPAAELAEKRTALALDTEKQVRSMIDAINKDNLKIANKNRAKIEKIKKENEAAA